jgi:hypothetical protein
MLTCFLRRCATRRSAARFGIPPPYHIGRKLQWRRSDLDRSIETKREGHLTDAEPQPDLSRT